MKTQRALVLSLDLTSYHHTLIVLRLTDKVVVNQCHVVRVGTTIVCAIELLVAGVLKVTGVGWGMAILTFLVVDIIFTFLIISVVLLSLFIVVMLALFLNGAVFILGLIKRSVIRI